jgi:hypothetical protein
MWTIYGLDGKESLDYRLLRVYSTIEGVTDTEAAGDKPSTLATPSSRRLFSPDLMAASFPTSSARNDSGDDTFAVLSQLEERRRAENKRSGIIKKIHARRTKQHTRVLSSGQPVRRGVTILPLTLGRASTQLIDPGAAPPLPGQRGMNPRPAPPVPRRRRVKKSTSKKSARTNPKKS